MKIAVATMDGVSLSQHFGQSTGFVVFELDGNTVLGRELRTNDRTPHAQGLCTGHHDHDEEAQQHGAHSHTGIVGLLGDCEVILCGGMGAGAAQALMQQGIRPMIIPQACSADDAVSHYLAGATSPTGAGFCSCGH